MRRPTLPRFPQNIPSSVRFIVGIDEAGRGPLAGPVAVGAVVVPVGKHPLFKRARDSKQLSPRARESIFKEIQKAQKENSLNFAVSLVSSQVIDAEGIVPAIRRGIKNCLNKLAAPPDETLILLDGSLHAPEHFLFQKTIIRGDESQSVIGLASIAAKVTRDRAMVRVAKKFPEYGFEIHKGYGTLLHRQKIKKHGPCEVHRMSFLKGYK